MILKNTKTIQKSLNFTIFIVNLKLISLRLIYILYLKMLLLFNFVNSLLILWA